MTVCFAAIIICIFGAQLLQEKTVEGAHAWKSAESGPPVNAPLNTNCGCFCRTLKVIVYEADQAIITSARRETISICIFGTKEPRETEVEGAHA